MLFARETDAPVRSQSVHKQRPVTLQAMPDLELIPFGQGGNEQDELIEGQVSPGQYLAKQIKRIAEPLSIFEGAE